MHIIPKSALILFTKNYQNQAMLVEATACQSTFFETVYKQIADLQPRQQSLTTTTTVFIRQCAEQKNKDNTYSKEAQ